MLHVVAGVLRDSAGRILLAQRPPGSDLAGQWEFPGGKLEAGEQALAALRRELREELAITVLDGRPLLRYRHRYPDKEILLDVWWVDRYAGIPQGMEQQALRWLRVTELEAVEMVAADKPVARLLQAQR